MSEERDMVTQDLNVEGEETLENHDLSEEVVSELDENVQKSLKSYKAQKEHFQNKTKKLESELNEMKTRINALSQKEEEQPQKKESNTSDAEWRERIEFMSLNAGKYDPSDIEKLSNIAKIEGVKLHDAVNSDLFKGYLKVKEEKAAEANTTPQPGSDSPVVNKYSNFENLKPEDISNMDSATFAKYEAYLASKSRNIR